MNIDKNVAPLAGSVDRNFRDSGSPAPRAVAPLAGSVDRNDGCNRASTTKRGRSPRGERG